MFRIFWFLLILVSLVGCAKSPFRTEVYVQDLDPKPIEFDCPIYDYVLPDRPYYVVGKVFMRSDHEKNSREYDATFIDLMEFTSSETRRIGGDAAIQLFTSSAGSAFRRGDEEFVASTIIAFGKADEGDS